MERQFGQAQSGEPSPSDQLVIVARLQRQLVDLMRVDDHAIITPPDAVIAFRGRVYDSTETAFEQITQRFATLGYTASLRDEPGGGHEVIVVKGVTNHKPGRVWLNVVLLVATLFTVLHIGAGYALQYADMITDPNARKR